MLEKSHHAGVKLDRSLMFISKKLLSKMMAKTIPRDLPFSIDLDPQTLDWSAMKENIYWTMQQHLGCLKCRVQHTAA